MSEQQIQNNELSKPVYLGENVVYNLGATTLRDLKNQKKINTYGATDALPIKEDGSFDLNIQKEIAQTYAEADRIKSALVNTLNTFMEYSVNFNGKSSR